MLAHERLDVYRCSVEFLAVVGLIIDGLPVGTAVLRDQLERASLSILANIAEGVGVPTSKERDRHLGIARGSAMECGALLDACRLRRLCTEEQLLTGKQRLVRIVSMLTRMMVAQGRATGADTLGATSPGRLSRSSRSALPDPDIA